MSDSPPATLVIDRQDYRKRLQICRETHRPAPVSWCSQRVLRHMARERGIALESVGVVTVQLWPTAMLPEEV